MRELALILAVLAQDEEPKKPTQEDLKITAPVNTAKDFVRFAFNFYDQSDGGGNKNLKEDMTVIEPMVLFSKGLSEKWGVTAKLQTDIISAASVDKRYRFAPGTQSGASGDKYFSIDAGVWYAWSDQTTLSGGVSFAKEYDYTSVGLNLKWAYDTESKNDTIVLKASAFFDTLDLIRFTGQQDGDDDRTSISFGAGWTHVFGPDTVGTVNWDLTIQNGFLATPYNSVFVAGTEVPEELPDSRVRNAVHARVRHLLLEDFAIEPGAGVYFDTWGAFAFNLELHAYWEVVPGTLILHPSYRFHWQSEVDDFTDPDDPILPEFRTQDSDLAEFTSHTVGLKALFPDLKIFGESMEIEIGGDVTMRSDGLDSFSFSFGIQWRF